MEAFILYVLVCLVAAIALYAVVRWIDYAFTKREDRRRYGYAVDGLDYAFRKTKKMSMSMIKDINNSIFDMAKSMEED